MGGYLAELTTMEEDISLGNYLIQGVFYWIGLSDNVSEGSWRWVESHQDVNYTNWGTGEGHDGTDCNCAFKSLHPSYLGWADTVCTWAEIPGYGQLHALCEK